MVQLTLICGVFFQLFAVSKKSTNILEIVLSTVAGFLFLVIMTFAMIIRRLYVKNLSYRKLEQGEPSPYLISSIICAWNKCQIHFYTYSMRAKLYITTLVLDVTLGRVWLFSCPTKVCVF